ENGPGGEAPKSVKARAPPNSANGAPTPTRPATARSERRESRPCAATSPVDSCSMKAMVHLRVKWCSRLPLRSDCLLSGCGATISSGIFACPMHNLFVSLCILAISHDGCAWQKVGTMDLKQLRTFVAVADARTVSKASLLLHISQPALSRQVSNLEQEFGLKL